MSPPDLGIAAASGLDLPLTHAQQGIWLGQQLEPTSARYNAAECIELDAAADAALLCEAITFAVAETDALRVRVRQTGAGPRQWLTQEPFTPRQLAMESRAQVDAWMRAELVRPLDLTVDGPYRGAVLTTDQSVFWFHAAHHVSLDGYGFAMIARRVAEIFGALAAGRRPPPRAFGSLHAVVEEDAAYHASEHVARDLSFWRERLDGMAPPVSFSERPAFVSDVPLRASAELPAELQRTLGAIAKSARGTWGDALIAALALQLRAATGADDIVLGLPVMNRLGSVALKVPCMAMNVVPLRITLQPDDSLVAVIARVVESLRAQRPHTRYRYEQLRRELGLVGGDRRLFGPVVNLMPFDLDLRFGELPAVVRNLGAGPVEDLSIGITAHGGKGGLKLVLDANPASYEPADLERIERDFISGLATYVSTPQVPVSPPAREAVVWGPALSAPAPDVIEAFAAHAHAQPDAVAIEHGTTRVRYGELAARVRGLSARLVARGVRPNNLVALLLPRGVDAIVAMLGVLSAGAAYVPLDVDGPEGRRKAVLDDAQPKLILTTAQHADRADGFEVLLLDRDGGTGGHPALDAAPSAMAYVIYTSGSTGVPNGVAISRGALGHFVAAACARYGFEASDRVLQFAPLHFDACVEEIFVTLCAGATLVLREESMLRSLPAFTRACADHALSVIDLPTAFWSELVFALSTGATTLPACVRSVIIGGEAALPERVARFRQAAPAHTRLFNTYGPTEATVVATSAELAGPDALTDDEAPIGAPLPGVGTLIVDAAGAPARVGQIGELCLLGPTLALGYLGRPALQARRFVTLPDGALAYRTGDRVRRRPDGLLTFVGRVDDELKISGQRVDPSEVEGVLLGHPQVREACVVAANGRLVAHVVVDAPAPSTEALRSHAQHALLAAAVPQTFVFAETLPKTRSGKLDRAALRTLTAERSRVAGNGSPSGLAEQVLTVFAEVLAQPELTASDDFFARGGQSLQTIQVANRLTSVVGREVDVALVFRHPTAAELARALSGEDAEVRGDAMTPARLAADAVLPSDVRPTGAPQGALQEVLLTGAAGFVGVHLLHALLTHTNARVTCIVRAGDDARAGARVREALARHALTIEESRVEVRSGDLSAPRLGLAPGAYDALASHCDTIVHAAAAVSLTRGYASLRGANVEATLALLRLCSVGRPKALHHVSTVAVGTVTEVPEAFVDAHEALHDGYTQSKWVAEQLVAQAIARGFDASVYRLGRVVGPLRTGFVSSDDIVWRLIRAGVPRGALPLLDVEEPWTPVDYVADAIVALAGRPRRRAVYNVAPAPAVRLPDVFAWVRDFGFDVTQLPVPVFVARLREARDPDSVATRAFFELRGDARAQGLGPIRCDHLHDLNLAPPVIDRSAVHRYLAHCVRHGLLPAVPTRRSQDLP